MGLKDIEQAGFAEIRLAELDALSPGEVDALPYGVVGMAADGIVVVYNVAEANLAGIAASTVMGSHYFAETAQCMNNFMVAQRFEDEPEIDAVIDYVLTLRMRPTPVRLRLLKSATVARRFVLIQR